MAVASSDAVAAVLIIGFIMILTFSPRCYLAIKRFFLMFA
jgi:hypothetical protein